MQTRFRCTCWLEKMPFLAGSFRNGLLRKMPCISVRHVEAPKLTEIDFSPNVRLLSICLRLLSFKGFISQRKNYVLSAICLHAFWTPLCHMKLLRPGLAYTTWLILHNQPPLAKFPVKWRGWYRLSPLKSTATEKPWEPGWSELTNFYLLFLCPLECSVNGVNFLTHITLTRVTEFFSDVKSGFDSKMKTETNKKRSKSDKRHAKWVHWRRHKPFYDEE